MKHAPIILAAAALLLLAPRRATAATTTTVQGAPRLDYPSPSALAGQLAGAVIEGLRFGFRASPTPGAVVNSAPQEAARAAVRANDPYYGAGALAWYAGNAEEARAAVRAGDPYYTSTAEAWADVGNIGGP